MRWSDGYRKETKIRKQESYLDMIELDIYVVRKLCSASRLDALKMLRSASNIIKLPLNPLRSNIIGIHERKIDDPKYHMLLFWPVLESPC